MTLSDFEKLCFVHARLLLAGDVIFETDGFGNARKVSEARVSENDTLRLVVQTKHITNSLPYKSRTRSFHKRRFFLFPPLMQFATFKEMCDKIITEHARRRVQIMAVRRNHEPLLVAEYAPPGWNQSLLKVLDDSLLRRDDYIIYFNDDFSDL